MPLNAPQSLTPDEVYAVSAYVLFLNGILPVDAKLDPRSLPKVAMPNRDGFVSAYSPPAAKP
jgi:cytochrome c